MNKTTNPKNVVKVKGFLTPKEMNHKANANYYQIIDAKKSYAVCADAEWSARFDKLCWQRVLLEGIFDKKSGTIMPMNIQMCNDGDNGGDEGVTPAA